MKHITLDIARDFSKTPGARTRSEGPHSGQEFREDFLERLFSDPERPMITVILDGAEGYATSFLEEAFGGLARKFGKEQVLSRLTFVSLEDSILLDEIIGYIKDTE